MQHHPLWCWMVGKIYQHVLWHFGGSCCVHTWRYSIVHSQPSYYLTMQHHPQWSLMIDIIPACNVVSCCESCCVHSQPSYCYTSMQDNVINMVNVHNTGLYAHISVLQSLNGHSFAVYTKTLFFNTVNNTVWMCVSPHSVSSPHIVRTSSVLKSTLHIFCTLLCHATHVLQLNGFKWLINLLGNVTNSRWVFACMQSLWK